jgi:hypothetical protein
VSIDAEDWATKSGAIYPSQPGWDLAIQTAQEIIDASHCPAQWFGVILNNLAKPRLGVITHCQFNQDTFIHALDEIRAEYSVSDIAWAVDEMVLNLRPGQKIRQRMGLFSDYAWNMNVKTYTNTADPKYDGPCAQFSDYIKAGFLEFYPCGK